jgi:hypothetical protein
MRSRPGYTSTLGDLQRITICNSAARAANWAKAMHHSIAIAAGQVGAPPGEPVTECDAQSSLAEPVCFGRRRRSDGGPLGLRLRAVHADALAELLPVLLCGEESATLAMDHIAGSRDAQDEMHAALAHIAFDELGHQALLQRVRAALPAPHDDPGLHAAMRRFFMRLASRDPATHCARIAAVDSAVCLLLGELRRRSRPIASEPTLDAIVARIHRDEARHVAVTSRYAAELRSSHGADDDVVEARHGLTCLLERRAVAMQDLGVDPDRLFKRLHATPRALRR